MKVEIWSVSQAKARFSEVVDAAQSHPQKIANRGKDIAIVMSMKEYASLRELKDLAAPEARMREFLRFSEDISRDAEGDFEIPKSADRPSPFDVFD